MTSEEISARNRANAARSTGPRTAAGKAAVAGNARSHGATARLDPQSVVTWLKIILDDPNITPADLLPQDEIGRRTLALAEAEARVVHCEQALQEFEVGFQDPAQVMDDYFETLGALRDELLASGAHGKSAERAFTALIRQTARDTVHDKMAGGNRHRLLQRYLREAIGARKRAFQAWAQLRAGRGRLAA